MTEAELKRSHVRMEGVQHRGQSLVNRQYPSEVKMLPGYCNHEELEWKESEIQQVYAGGRDVRAMCPC